MKKWIAESITGLDIGPPRSHRNLVIFPLLAEGDAGPEYLTLGEALQDELVTTTEVSESGTVSKLKVRNEADKPVLLLDGQELSRAKQNRVVNTTALAAENASEYPEEGQ